MNQGRIWCVVNPTVGLPLFLGSVAVTSLIVHYSVLSNTSWFSSYWNGKAKPKAALVEGAAPAVAMNSVNGAPGLVISVAPVVGSSGNAEASYVITVAPKPVTTAQVDAAADSTAAHLPDSLALAAPSTK
jgi:light-harvesting protein B-800-850 alpha chain